jgi:hypothetical protein
MVSEEAFVTVGRSDSSMIVVTLGAKLMVEQLASAASCAASASRRDPAPLSADVDTVQVAAA